MLVPVDSLICTWSEIRNCARYVDIISSLTLKVVSINECPQKYIADCPAGPFDTMFVSPLSPGIIYTSLQHLGGWKKLPSFINMKPLCLISDKNPQIQNISIFHQNIPIFPLFSKKLKLNLSLDYVINRFNSTSLFIQLKFKPARFQLTSSFRRSGREKLFSSSLLTRQKC